MLLYKIAAATEIKTLKGRFRISVAAFEGFLSTLVVALISNLVFSRPIILP